VVGLLSNLRSWLWVPVGQDSYRRICLRLMEHLLALDLAYHLRRKTGEVTRVVDRGTAAMQNVLSTVIFSIAPQLLDVLLASCYLAAALEPWIALVVFITVGSYIPLTIAVTEWRGAFRQRMNTTDNVKSARATDALLNYETVKLFTNEGYELKQFGDAIDDYQRAEYKWVAGAAGLLGWCCWVADAWDGDCGLR
jgi:ATP-binding cassette subfamily B (MDR/TAP) protein 6